MDLTFEQFCLKGCMTYLISGGKTDEVWLVDPVLDEVDSYLRLLQSRKQKLTCVIDTHTHADHLSAGSKLAQATSCAYIMHALGQPKSVTERLKDDATIKIGSTSVKLLHTPGHTRDSMCLVFPDRILTGDTLFLDDGGAGRMDLPGGDAAEHWDSLRKLQLLADSLVIFPGHEYRNRRPSTLKEQKERNPFLKYGAKESYVNFIEELKLGPAEWMKDVLKANSHGCIDRSAVHIPGEGNACEVQGTLPLLGTNQHINWVEPKELKQMLDQGSDLCLIDVREATELAGPLGHLPKIKHIPVASVRTRLGDIDVDKNSEVVMICKMGGRAKTAAQILVEAGFTQVKVLKGGMAAWNQHGK